MESSKNKKQTKTNKEKTQLKTMHHNEIRQRTETISEINLMWKNQGL